jgi:hypothetical protein
MIKTTNNDKVGCVFRKEPSENSLFTCTSFFYGQEQLIVKKKTEYLKIENQTLPLPFFTLSEDGYQ